MTIQKAVANKSLPQPFLSKHAKGNPGNHKTYFIRVARGKYKLITE